MRTHDCHIVLNAHLLTAQTGYRSAGINGYIYHLLQALPDVDPAFTYTALMGDQAALQPRSQMRVRRTPWSTENPLRRVLWEQIMQPAALWRLHPDLVHALAFVAPVLNRVPTVVTVYDLSFVHYPGALPAARRLYLRLLTRHSCQRARRIIAISDSTARDLVATLGLASDKIDVAAPGVGEQFYPLPDAEIEAFRQRYELPERFLLFVGTLEPRKNLPMLLRAYAQLPASDRAAVHLILAGGKGWMYEDVFRTIEEEGLGDTVHLPGYVNADTLPLWYNAAEALVFPSLFEGFGLPILEAMACGTPVLVSNVSSLPEAAGDAGFCLPPDNESAWTDALAHTIHHSDWRENAGEKGHARASFFTWASTAAQTAASYRRALNLKQEALHV